MVDDMNCPICGSEDVVVNQQLSLKDSKVRKIYLNGSCKKCGAQLTIEFTPTSARQQTVD
jgi:transcription elongation factor Elf1